MKRHTNKKKRMGVSGVTIEKKKKFIINALYFVIIFALFYLGMLYLFNWIWPFLLAFFIAMMLQRPLDFISRHSRINRRIASIILIFFVFAIAIVLIGLVGARIVDEVKGFVSYVTSRMDDLPKLLDTVKLNIIHFLRFLPDEMEASVTENINEMFEGLKHLKLSSIDFSGPLGGLWGAARQVPNIIITCIVTFISTMFMTMDYRSVVRFIHNQLSPKNQVIVTETKHIFMTTIWRMLRAYLLIMLITFCELTLGFYILKWCNLLSIDYVITLAAVIAVVDILPVLGVGVVLIPWAIISLIAGNGTLGIGLIVMYVIITIIRNYIEPRIVGNQIGLNPILTLMGMYLGLQAFGFIGMFGVPMIIIILKLLQDSGKVHIWKTQSETTKTPSKSGNA